ncbi:MAG: chloride channel protein [Chitinophagaceae bacterium]|nr:MAG: chloride channel protein [Chitinophagaceae bacterium]
MGRREFCSMNETTPRKTLGRFTAWLHHPFGRQAAHALPFWFASLAVGIVAVLYTRIFGFGEHLQKEMLHAHPAAVFLLSPLFFLLAWLPVHLWARFARGSGIPQVMAAIDLSVPGHEHKVGKLVSLRVLWVKVVSSFLMVLGGGAIGREGPTIQISASIFRWVSRRIPQSWPRMARQSFLLTGAAAGLAAAFNTPLGGLVFAVEELARVHVRYFRTALFTSVIISGLVAQGLLGPYLYLGYPDVGGLSIRIFPAVIVVSLLAGAGGAAFCKAILAVLQRTAKFKVWGQVTYIVLAGLAMAALCYFVDPGVQGSGKELINRLLFTADKTCGISTVFLRMIGPLLTFNVGAAGGVFAPALASGAAIGGCCSGWFGFGGAAANVLILAGMVSFLTGVTRTPFTSAILVLEMTDRHNVIFHLLLAALVASLVAHLVDRHSFYDRMKGRHKAALAHETADTVG